MSKNHQKSAKTTPKPSKITGIIGSANFYFLRPKNWVVVSNIFYFHGEMIQLDLHIFFNWVVKNQQVGNT